MNRTVFLVGASHRSAPVEERERLVDVDAPALLAALGPAGVDEAVVVSTCNRVEVYLAGRDGPIDAQARAWLAGHAGRDAAWVDTYAYTASGRDAARHLFRVASSLDSLVVGESQVVGQVKQAFHQAHESGSAGPVLSRAFHQALHAAKRVRSETRIAENAVSISYAAVELAKKVFGSLQGKVLLVVGAGKMGGLALKHLQAAGATQVFVANRSRERAIEAAGQIGGSGHGLDELDALLDRADIVISSTGSQHFVLRFEDVKAATSRRRFRPLFLIDIAVPRDVDPRCDGLPNVYLFDVDDLEKVVDENRRLRQAEATKAEVIVGDECQKFMEWLSHNEVVPTIVSLRHKLTLLKDAEVSRALRDHPDLPPEAREVVEQVARALVNKILHEPTISLRNATQTGHHGTLVTAVRSLFALSDEGLSARQEPE